MSRADFIEETTTSIAGTSGNGAVTLTQVTGLPRFSSVFGTSARMVDYVIEDTVGLKFEKGYGTVSSNVLTRDKVHETWDGTTFTSTAPSALAFGSTPTSGNIRIRLAPTSDAFMPAPPAIVTALSSNDQSGGNGWMLTAHLPGLANGNNNTYGNTLEYYYPHLNLTKGQVNGVAIYCGSGNSGAAVKLGLYEVDHDGLPGPCLFRVPALALTSSGFIADTTPSGWSPAGAQRLGMGWYYLGLIFANTTGVLLTDTYSYISQRVAGPLPREGGYGWGSAVTKTMENSYSTGLPSGTPVKTGYSLRYTNQVPQPWFWTKITN